MIGWGSNDGFSGVDVTTQNLRHDQLQILSDEVGEGGSRRLQLEDREPEAVAIFDLR